MQIYMLIMMKTERGWRRTKFVKEMPEHSDRDEARRIAYLWAKNTIPSHMAYEPLIAVVVRATGPYARPSYITHQTINFDGIRAVDVIRAVKCACDESYPEQFKPWDSAGAMMKVNNNDMNIACALSRHNGIRPASKNQVDSVVLPFIDRMINQ